MHIRQSVLAFAVLMFIAGPLWAEPLPLDDFIKHGDYLDLKISPDGRHLAARLRNDERVYMVFIRAEDGKVVGGLKPQGKDEIHSITWVSNERVVYEIARRQSHVDELASTGELYGVNIDNTRSKLLYGFRAGDAKTGTRISRRDDTFASQEVLSILPDDDKNILIIEYPWSLDGNYWYDYRDRPSQISKLNVFNGRKKRLEMLPHNGADAIASLSGEVNFISWMTEDRDFKAAFRNDPDEEWQPLNVPFSDHAPRPVAVNADATKVYFLVPYGEREINTMFELELATGEYTQLFENLESDLTSWEVDWETLEPVVGVTESDRSHYHYVESSNSPMVKLHKMLARAFKDQDMSISSATSNGDHLVIRLGSDVDPGEYQILNTETKVAEFLWANRSWLDPRKMRPMQHLQFEADDGVEFFGYLTLPEMGEGSAKPPLLVLPHGGPHGIRDYWQFDREVQLFANRGYAVLQVNYRGSGGYGEAFERMGHREWGGKMIDDIIAATESVAAEGTVDGDRMCIYGGSYGGYAALMSAVRAPQLFKCTIGFAGVYDLSLTYEEGDIPDSWGGVAYLELVLGRDEAQLAEFSPVNHVDKIEAAIMLIHGDKDRRVPVEHAEVMRERLEEAGKDVVWQLYGRSGHGVWDIETRREMYEGILEFLQANIGTAN